MTSQTMNRVAVCARRVAASTALVWFAGLILIPRDVQAAIATGWNACVGLPFLAALLVWSLADLMPCSGGGTGVGPCIGLSR